MSRLLKDAADIRQWAEARGGNPLLMDVPTGTGRDNTLLTISFGQHVLESDNDGPDRATGGYQVVGWDEWIEAMNAKNLILKVKDYTPGVLDNEFEFADAEGERGETSAAAQQPPAITTESADQSRVDREGLDDDGDGRPDDEDDDEDDLDDDSEPRSNT